MANSLASLVVSLEANIAKFTTDMGNASAVTQKTMKGIQDSVSGAKSAFLNLAASVVSVGAVVHSIKGAIELGDQLKTMSDATGIAIDKLDQLSIMAKLNGAGLDDIAKGFKGLTKAMVESQDSTSKSGKIFAALGVAVKDASGNLRGTDEVMADVAKALNSIENETTRAAVGTAIFGKSYLQIAATLRNFKEDQEAANTILEKFGGVSVRAAVLADDLGDQFTLLGEGSKRAFLSGLVPGMAAAGQAIKELINQGGAFQASFGDVISQVVTFVSAALVNLKGAFEITGVAIAAVAASIATGSLQPLKDLPGEIAKIEAGMKAATARIFTAAKFPGLDDSDQISRAAGAVDRLGEAAARSSINSKKLNDALNDGKGKVSDYAKAMADLAKQLIAAQASLDNTLGGTEKQVPALTALLQKMNDPVWKTWTAQQQLAYQMEATLVIGIQEHEAAVKKLLEQTKLEIESDEKLAETQQKLIDHRVAVVNSYAEGNEKLRQENDIIGQSALAHALLAAKIEYETKVRELGDDKLGEATEHLREDYEVRKRLITEGFQKTEFVQQWNDAFNAISARFTDFFVDLFNNGFKAFKNLWSSFKELAFRALAEVAAKQIVVSITGAVTGVGASAAQAAGGAGGILSNIGSIFSGGFGGGGGLLGAAGGFGGAQTAALDSFLITSGFQNLAGGVLTQIAGPLMAAAPWAAIGAIAIPAIVKLFDKGPASRTATFASGAASLVSDASRDAVFQGKSAFGAFGIAKDFWLGPEAGAAFKPTLDAITSLDNAISQMVGGDLTKQIASALAAHSVTVGLGKEGTDINASGGPAQILKDRYVTVLNAIDASLGALLQGFKGTGEELANFVVTLVSLREALGKTFANLKGEDIAALGEAFGGIDKLATSLSFLNANFTSQAEQAAKSQESLVDAFTKLGLAVPVTHKAFLDLLSSFDLTTDSGRALYAAVMNLSGAFVEVNGTATQAAAALKQSFANLNAAVAAYNNVPAEQQKSSELTSLLKQLVASTGNTGWQAMIDALGQQGFVGQLALLGQMPEEFAKFSAANQALITQIISTAAEIKQTAPSGVVYPGQAGYPLPTGAPPTTAGGGAPAQTPQQIVADMLAKFAALTDQSTGSFGEKLALQIRLVGSEIQSMSRNPAMAAVARLLRQTNIDLGASLTLFNSLATRYTTDIAAQLTKLTQSYKEQADGLKGNAVALDVLHQVFEEQWAAIITGTAEGVDGTLDELRRLQQGVLDYVDSLKIGSDSPLTAMEKLAEAQRQYQENLTKANAGDTTALGAVTGSADAYIKLAREFYASSATYTGIFNQVTGDLTALGTKDFGAGAAPMNAADQALLDALPVGSTIMSALDLQDINALIASTVRTTVLESSGGGVQAPTSDAMAAYLERVRVASSGRTSTEPLLTEADAQAIATPIVEAIYESARMVARSNTDDAAKVSDRVDASRAAIVEAFAVGTK